MPRSLRRTLTVAFVVAVLGAAVGAVHLPAAAAVNPIHPDNRPSTVAGHTNGELPPLLLRHASPTCLVFRDAAPSLISMIAAARRDGVILHAVDCYRDYAGQVAMRQLWCGRNACHMAAVPGTSNHGWAKAVDFRDQNGGLTFSSAGYLWLKNNAARFGWNHPGVMGPTGSVPEPWHWEWVGDGGRMFPGISFGYGIGIGLPADGWPQGSLDIVSQASVAGWAGRARVAGWAIDPNTTASIDTHVWINWKTVTPVRANRARSDIRELFAGYAASGHGFDVELPLLYGRHDVCVFAIDAVRPGGNNLLGCRNLSIGTDPIGSLDSVTPGPGGAIVRGWALDASSEAPVVVEIRIGEEIVATVDADRARPDVTSVFSGYDVAGFQALIPLPHGRHTVCAVARNVGPGADRGLGCREVDADRNPFGSLDVVRAVPGGLEVAGWAIDPDTIDGIPVHVYVDGLGRGALDAALPRPDVGAVFPAYGPNHGFRATFPAASGPRQVCVYAINVGPGTVNPRLGCRTVTV
jgi:hypothetical protein